MVPYDIFCEFQNITLCYASLPISFKNTTYDSPRITEEIPLHGVLLDLQMPIMDGLEICRRIKQSEHRPFTYVVMLTSRDAEQERVQTERREGQEIHAEFVHAGG